RQGGSTPACRCEGLLSSPDEALAATATSGRAYWRGEETGDRGGGHTAMKVLDQRYELLEHLGSGAMASVWRAHDRRLDREVAVKMLSEQLASDPAFRERFEREAVHVASLKHPNIVTVYDAGSDGDTYYIVMELVEGESLQSRLEATAPYMELERTAELAAQLLAGLSHAHSKGI